MTTYVKKIAIDLECHLSPEDQITAELVEPDKGTNIIMFKKMNGDVLFAVDADEFNYFVEAVGQLEEA